MRFYIVIFFLISFLTRATAQENNIVLGVVVDEQSKQPLSDVLVTIEGSQISSQTNNEGVFTLNVSLKGDYILAISATDFVSKRIPLTIGGKDIDLKIIYLERDITLEQTDNLITLTDSELLDD